MNKSYLKNCLIIKDTSQKDDPFLMEGGEVYCRLDGYAIIPIRDYQRLKGIEENNTRDTGGR